MKSGDLIKLIRKEVSDQDIASMLKEYGVLKTPKRKGGDTNVYVDLPKFGLYFVFTDQAFLEKRGDMALGKLPLILNNVTFNSARIPPYADYSETLPFNLNFSDSKDEVHKKLGAPDVSIAPRRLERWSVENFWVAVVYSEDLSAVNRVTVQIPNK